MINLIADYHTHTLYSHGKGTILDNVLAAKDKGLKEIAITDHSFRHFAFGVKKRKIKKMRQEIDSINEKYADIKVLLGLECNIISKDGKIDVDEDSLKYLDIVALGYHMLVLAHGFLDYYHIYLKNYFSKLNKTMAKRMTQYNTDIMIKAINNYDIDFITHPGARIPMDIRKLSYEASRTNTALEINANSNIMTVEDIKTAAKLGAKFVINSDAHRPSDIGNFKDALLLAKEAGLKDKQIINAAGYLETAVGGIEDEFYNSNGSFGGRKEPSS